MPWELPRGRLDGRPQGAGCGQVAEGAGRGPGQARKVEKLKASNPAGDSFRVVALEWYGKQKDQWSAGHAERSMRQFERDLFPWLGERRLGGIEPVELLAALRKIEERGAVEAADRCLMLARQVWHYGMATGRAGRDITAGLKGALLPYRGTHFAAITDPSKLAELLRAIQAYKGGPIVRTALQLAPLLFQRPGELRGVVWSEIDLDTALWTILATRMKRAKNGKEHGDRVHPDAATRGLRAVHRAHRLAWHGLRAAARDHRRRRRAHRVPV